MAAGAEREAARFKMPQAAELPEEGWIEAEKAELFSPPNVAERGDAALAVRKRPSGDARYAGTQCRKRRAGAATDGLRRRLRTRLIGASASSKTPLNLYKVRLLPVRQGMAAF